MKRKGTKIKKMLEELLTQGFFNDWKTPEEVLKKFAQRGITLKGRQIGELNTTITKMCQNSTTGLEREELPKEMWRKAGGKWKYKKVR
ncbi:MAG: hypothetical protein OH319_03520 [Candidatus Parvarchaeota archaeon]|nr:hypothetical protein [Candidatus Jingweiarchaeum tengchongense]MCW1304574.1 hypothetical protein [Candidatus Jingweiarchaeum tengchongense]MCW1310246.1 hypothetical protein [Candidatus Jingweiarchaeum tengchongense]